MAELNKAGGKKKNWVEYRKDNTIRQPATQVSGKLAMRIGKINKGVAKKRGTF